MRQCLDKARAAGLQPVMEALNSAKHLLAGALSAVVSRTCCAPLERVKMQMMFQSRAAPPLAVAWGILRQEGLPGFWRGNGAWRACFRAAHCMTAFVMRFFTIRTRSLVQASISCGQPPTRCYTAEPFQLKD